MATSEEDFARLATAVKKRRAERFLTQQDVEARGGPSTTTQYWIESGEKNKFSAKILRREARALGWTEDSCLVILHGGEPTEVDAAGTTAPTTVRIREDTSDPIEIRLSTLRDRLSRLDNPGKAEATLDDLISLVTKLINEDDPPAQ